MVNDFFVRLTFIIQSPWPASSLETQTSPLHLFTKPLPPIFPALFFRFNSRGEGENKDPRGRSCNLLASARSSFVPALFSSLAFSRSRRDLWNLHHRRRPSVSPSVPNVEEDNRSGDRYSYKRSECAVICTGEERLNVTELCFSY